MTTFAHRPLRVAAVVPALEEVEAIGPVVAGLLRNGACCVLVVDGGSRDGTTSAATRAGAVAITGRRRGYGRACLTGMRVALSSGHAHDAVAFLDGDGSCDPADLPGLVDGLADADVVLGRRDGALIEPGALPWHARLGNLLVAAIIRARTRRSVADLPPFKVARTGALRRMALDEPGYGWTVQFVCRALLDPQLGVVERPAGFRVRRGGSSKVSGALGPSIAAGRRMIQVALAETRARPAVALVAKPPQPGRAKTRLGSEIGQERADRFWQACLADLGARLGTWAGETRAPLLVVVPEPDDIAPVLALTGCEWQPRVQERTGLSGAIVDALGEAWRRGAPSAVVLSGDNPTLPVGHVEEALRALAHHPAVLGPCPDGGYFLVGLRTPASVRWPLVRPLARRWQLRRVARAFASVRMGGDRALSSTIEALRASGWPPALTAPWSDVDHARDLEALSASIRADPVAAPHTRAWLGQEMPWLLAGGPPAGPGEPSGVDGVPHPAMAVVAS